MDFAKSNELAIVSEEPPIEATMSIHGLDMSNLCINYVCSGNPSAFKMIYSKMTRDEFIQILKRGKYSYEIDGDKLVVTEGDTDGDVNLNARASLPPNVVFKNKGFVDLSALITLPPGFEFKNGGTVDLATLTSLPPDVQFKNGRSVYLGALTSLPPEVEFKNEGDVDLYALIGGYFGDWKGNIKGINSDRLLNFMISKGVFEK